MRVSGWLNLHVVIGGMEFDPDTQTWLGNDDALSAFSPQQPALITNIGKHDKAKGSSIHSHFYPNCEQWLVR